MSQLNLYLPAALAQKVRRAAKEKRVSVSKYVATLLESAGRRGEDGWDADFFESVVGRWQGKLSREKTRPVEERDPL